MELPKIVHLALFSGNISMDHESSSKVTPKTGIGPYGCGEHPGDRNHQDFPKSATIQMGSVLRYAWEEY